MSCEDEFVNQIHIFDHTFLFLRSRHGRNKITHQSFVTGADPDRLLVDLKSDVLYLKLLSILTYSWKTCAIGPDESARGMMNDSHAILRH